MPTEADIWRDLAEGFKSLAREEQTEGVWRNNLWLRAVCDYTDRPIVVETGKPEQGPFSLLRTPKCGLWVVYGGANEGFRSRFEALATRAGARLGPPQGTAPLDYWLHRLFRDLRENQSERLLGASDTGAIIDRVCEASVLFCAHLEKAALETSADALEKDPSRKAAKPWFASNPDILKRRQIVLQNPRRSARALCTVFDTERVPLPGDWEERYGVTTWTEAYEKKKARAAIQRIVSTDKKST